MYKRLVASVLLLLSVVGPAKAEDKFTIGLQSSVTKDHKHIIIVSVFQDGAVVSDENLPKSNAANHANCFVLQRLDKNKKVVEEVEVEIRKSTGQGIQLIPKKSLDFSKGSWSLLIRKDCVRTSHTISNDFENQQLAIDTDAWKRDEEFLKNSLPESKIELKQGSKTGAVSFNASFKHYFDQKFSDLAAGYDSPLDAQSTAYKHAFTFTDALVQGHLSVDASIEPSQKGQYLNNIEGEIGGYISGVALNSLTEIGFSTKTQADQEFDKIDQTVGINLWSWINQNWVDDIARAFFVGGERPSYQDHLLVIVGEDYVGHLKNASAGNPDYDGNNRFSVRLYWRIPVARGIDLHQITPLDQQFDLDLLADVKGTYDFDNSKLAPEIKISADFKITKLKAGMQQPSMSFSYVDGRAAPKFEHFDAFLAGIKVPF